jgi:hypothetical protein
MSGAMKETWRRVFVVEWGGTKKTSQMAKRDEWLAHSAYADWRAACNEQRSQREANPDQRFRIVRYEPVEKPDTLLGVSIPLKRGDVQP